MKPFRPLVLAVATMLMLLPNLPTVAQQSVGKVKQVTREVVLSKFIQGFVVETFTISPDGQHLAFGFSKDKIRYMVRDGKIDKGYDHITLVPH